MKVKIYLRVAKNTGGRTAFKVDARPTPDYRPLNKGQGTYTETPLPTAAFAVVLDVPDELFRHAERVLAEIEIPADKAVVAAEVAEAA